MTPNVPIPVVNTSRAPITQPLAERVGFRRVSDSLSSRIAALTEIQRKLLARCIVVISADNPPALNVYQSIDGEVSSDDMTELEDAGFIRCPDASENLVASCFYITQQTRDDIIDDPSFADLVPPMKEADYPHDPNREPCLALLDKIVRKLGGPDRGWHLHTYWRPIPRRRIKICQFDFSWSPGVSQDLYGVLERLDAERWLPTVNISISDYLNTPSPRIVFAYDPEECLHLGPRETATADASESPARIANRLRRLALHSIVFEIAREAVRVRDGGCDCD